MKYPQAEYHNLGYRYEKATSANSARAVAETLRHMIQAEAIDEQQDARYFIERVAKKRGLTYEH